MYKGDIAAGQSFTITPRWLRKDKMVTSRARDMWLFMRESAYDRYVCFPTLRDFMDELDLTREQVKGDRNQLKKAGCFEQVRWINRDGDEAASCYIMWPATRADFTDDELIQMRWADGGHPMFPALVEVSTPAEPVETPAIVSEPVVTTAPAPVAEPVEDPTPPPPPGTMPTLEQLTVAWESDILGKGWDCNSMLKPKNKALYNAGRFVGVDGHRTYFSLPNRTHHDRCAEARREVEGVLSAYFGLDMELALRVDELAA
jgi:hypothetical protein